MMKEFLNRIICKLTRKGLISQNDQELYLYALKVLIKGIVNLATIIVIGYSMSLLKESLVLFASFYILRKFTGGYHAQSFLTCYISSITIFSLSLLFLKNASSINNWIWYVLVFISDIIIIVFAPIKHPNKQISNKEAALFKTVSIILIVLLSTTSYIIINNSNSLIGFSIAIGIFIVSLLVLLGQIANKKLI